MTIKELAYFTDKNRTTIERWCSKCTEESILNKVQNAHKGNPADFTLDEVESILNRGSLSKDAVLILMGNAREKDLVKPNDVDYELIGKMIGEAVKAAVMPLYAKMNILPSEEKKALPAPAIPTRKALSQIVRNYAVQYMDSDFSGAWHKLYDDMLYRIGRNIPLCAKNRGISGPEYLEQEGLIEISYSISMEIMGE